MILELVFGFINLALFVWMVLILIKPQQFLPFIKGSNAKKRILCVIGYLVVFMILTAVMGDKNKAHEGVSFEIVNIDTLNYKTNDKVFGKEFTWDNVKKLTFDVNIPVKCDANQLDSIAKVIIKASKIKEDVNVFVCFNYKYDENTYSPLGTVNRIDGNFSTTVNDVKEKVKLTKEVLPPNDKATIIGVFDWKGTSEAVVIYKQNGKIYEIAYNEKDGYYGEPEERPVKIRNGEEIYVENESKIGDIDYIHYFKIRKDGNLQWFVDDDPSDTWSRLQ